MSYQKPFVFSVSMFYSQIFKFIAKNWSDLCNFYCKVIFFLIFVEENIFHFSLLNLNF